MGLSSSFSLLFTSLTFGDELELTLEQCPPAVSKAITENLNGAKLDEIEKITIGGRSIYVVEADLRQGRDLEFHLEASGNLIKWSADTRLKDVPKAVQDKITHFGGKLDDLERVKEKGRETFHAEIKKGNTEYKIVLNTKGEELSRITELDD